MSKLMAWSWYLSGGTWIFSGGVKTSFGTLTAYGTPDAVAGGLSVAIAAILTCLYFANVKPNL